jgi:hypothetical protein
MKPPHDCVCVCMRVCWVDSLTAQGRQRLLIAEDRVVFPRDFQLQWTNVLAALADFDAEVAAAANKARVRVFLCVRVWVRWRRGGKIISQPQKAHTHTQELLQEVFIFFETQNQYSTRESQKNLLFLMNNARVACH